MSSAAAFGLLALCLIVPSQGALATPPKGASRTLTGVAFSGGGSRAYVAALGQLQALRELGLLDKVDHIAGVSGGAWASAVNTVSDGISSPLVSPTALDLADLMAIPAHNAPAHLAVCRTSILASAARILLCEGRSPYKAWRAAVHATFLAPLGLEERATLTSALRGNGQARPAVHLGVTVLGEASAAPFALAERRFACVDCSSDGARLIGGEPYLPPSAASPTELPSIPLADALAMSSFFPGAPLQTEPSAAASGHGELSGGWDDLVARIVSQLRRAAGSWVRVSLPNVMWQGTRSQLPAARRN